MKNIFSIFLLIFLTYFSAFAQNKKLTVLYSNHLHTHLEPQIIQWVDKTRPVGGFANIATLGKREKAANNGILQISKGVEVAYDENKPLGKRTVCKINGVLLDDNKTYKVLTSNFLADGGDGFSAFKKTALHKNTRIEILQAMIKYLKKFEIYEGKIEGRVKKNYLRTKF